MDGRHVLFGGLSLIRVLHSGKYGTFLDMTVPLMLHQLLNS
jgi:hypothetical protein